MKTPVQPGDLLYAVGPAPDDLAKLHLYSTVVKDVRWDGSFSESATPEDYASATFTIYLEERRPTRGFPLETYNSFALGASVHRSAIGAIHRKYEDARYDFELGESERARAECIRESAKLEIAWTLDQAADRLIAIAEELATIASHAVHVPGKTTAMDKRIGALLREAESAKKPLRNCLARTHAHHIDAACAGTCCTTCGGPIDENEACRC